MATDGPRSAAPGRPGGLSARPLSPSREPAVYRPFALLAYGGALLVGVPLGAWMLAWLYLGAPAVPAPWVALHAAVQIFGFFGVLIVGVAHHLLARFTGRPVRASRLTPWWLGLLAAALALRLAAAAGAAVAGVAAAAATAAAFALHAAWVWRTLDPPPLAPLRRQLALASGALAAAAALEGALRARGGLVPDPALAPVVYALGLAGVLGWVLGVLLRAGPMFVRDWHVPAVVGRAAPWLLAAAVAAAAAGVAGAGLPFLRLSDLLLLAPVAATVASAGALRRRDPRALPMLSRSAPESRLFSIAAVSALGGTALAALAVAGEALGAPVRPLADAVRHVLTVGVVTSVVIAMTFRLLPVIEARPLPWPGLRALAFWALAAAVVLRTVQAIVPWVGRGAAPLVAASGVLAWIAIACAGLSLARVALAAARAGSGPGDATSG